MALKRDVNIGERFSPMSPTSFGVPSSNVFEVTQIRTATAAATAWISAFSFEGPPAEIPAQEWVSFQA